MAIDFYLRSDDDYLFQNGIIDVSDDLSILITQIEMILLTDPLEVFGEPNLSIGLDWLLWESNLNEVEIKTKIEQKISEYCPASKSYRVNVAVYFVEGSVYDMGVIDIYINERRVIRTLMKNTNGG